MASTFNHAQAFAQDIGGWDVSNVESMTRMFSGATSFNQDLSGWCLPQFDSKPANFDTNAESWREDWRPRFGAQCSTED